MDNLGPFLDPQQISVYITAPLPLLQQPRHYRSNRLVLTLYRIISFVSLQKAKFQAAADRLARLEQVGGKEGGGTQQCGREAQGCVATAARRNI